MRIAVAALCMLALTGSAGAADYLWACEQYDAIPDEFRQTPTVDWYVYELPLKEVRTKCGDARFSACAIKISDQRWKILIDETISGEEQTCVIQYEMAHLPPNFWGDPRVETPATIKWNADQRAAYLKGHISP